MSEMQPIEVQEFISQLVRQIEDGVDIETRNIADPIEIELYVEKVTKAEGGIKFYVSTFTAGVSAGGKGGQQHTHIAKAKFRVYPRMSERTKQEIEWVEQRNSEARGEWFL